MDHREESGSWSVTGPSSYSGTGYPTIWIRTVFSAIVNHELTDLFQAASSSFAGFTGISRAFSSVVNVHHLVYAATANGSLSSTGMILVQNSQSHPHSSRATATRALFVAFPRAFRER